MTTHLLNIPKPLDPTKQGLAITPPVAQQGLGAAPLPDVATPAAAPLAVPPPTDPNSVGNIAAGLMVHQFTRYLREIPVDLDTSVNLLAGEWAVA